MFCGHPGNTCTQPARGVRHVRPRGRLGRRAARRVSESEGVKRWTVSGPRKPQHAIPKDASRPSGIECETFVEEFRDCRGGGRLHRTSGVRPCPCTPITVHPNEQLQTEQNERQPIHTVVLPQGGATSRVTRESLSMVTTLTWYQRVPRDARVPHGLIAILRN